jgi:hypothetical protein
MDFRDLVKNPKVMIGTGMFFLLLVSLALIGSVSFPIPHNDGFAGFLYGVSIGCPLVGLQRRSVSGR